jgi:hypothetical protein
MKIGKEKLKSQIKLFLIISLTVLVLILYLNNIIPKKLSSFLPNSDMIINSCIINKMDKIKVELEGNNLNEFINLLENTSYYYDGKKNNILKGNLYHVEFAGKNNELEEFLFNMIISDENIIYIEDKQYNIKSDDTKIIDFLYTLIK